MPITWRTRVPDHDADKTGANVEPVSRRLGNRRFRGRFQQRGCAGIDNEALSGEHAFEFAHCEELGVPVEPVTF